MGHQWHHMAMVRMGIREVRRTLTAVIRRVRTGETIEVTDHWLPVARIVPIHHRSRYEQMVAEGRLTRAEGRLANCEPSLRP